MLNFGVVFCHILCFSNHISGFLCTVSRMFSFPSLAQNIVSSFFFRFDLLVIIFFGLLVSLGLVCWMYLFQAACILGHFPFSFNMTGVTGSVSLGLPPWLLELKCIAPGSLPFRVSTEKSAGVLMAFTLYLSCVFSLLIYSLVVYTQCFNYDRPLGAFLLILSLEFFVLHMSCWECFSWFMILSGQCH